MIERQTAQSTHHARRLIANGLLNEKSDVSRPGGAPGMDTSLPSSRESQDDERSATAG